MSNHNGGGWSHEDDRLAAEIVTAAGSHDYPRVIRLLRAYYLDLDRVYRTPRALIAAHVVYLTDTLIAFFGPFDQGDEAPPRRPRKPRPS
jgi:hypothetical protein